MENKLLEFKNKVKIKEEVDKTLAELKVKSLERYRHYTPPESVVFKLYFESSKFLGSFTSYDNGEVLELDSEDLEYFKKKYLPKLDEEYENNLKELNGKYGKV